jgi:hypothetical protein
MTRFGVTFVFAALVLSACSPKPEQASALKSAAVRQSPPNQQGPTPAAPTKDDPFSGIKLMKSNAPSSDQVKAAITSYQTQAGKEAPDLRDCSNSESNDACVAAQYTFVHDDWYKAWKGDIEHARNVAYCLSSSCSGAIAENRIQGCGWALAIIASASGALDESDARHADEDCQDLSPAALSTAQIRAAEIHSRIPHLSYSEE